MKTTIQEIDDEFKVIIVGSSGVGKSALLLRFVDDKFDNELLSATIGVDFKFRTIDVDGRNLKLQIWDTAGQENFRTIVSAYYKGADAIIVVYDHSDPQTFGEVEEFWLSEINEHKQEECVVMILANKCDLEGEQLNEVRVKSLKKHLGASLSFDVSAKTSDMVENAFREMARQIQKRKIKKASNPGTKLSFSGAPEEKQKTGCCK